MFSFFRFISGTFGTINTCRKKLLLSKQGARYFFFQFYVFSWFWVWCLRKYICDVPVFFRCKRRTKYKWELYSNGGLTFDKLLYSEFKITADLFALNTVFTLGVKCWHEKLYSSVNLSIIVFIPTTLITTNFADDKASKKTSNLIQNRLHLLEIWYK